MTESERRRVAGPAPPRARYRLADLRAGDPDAPDPLEGRSWPELRAAIYGDPADASSDTPPAGAARDEE